jgi:RimJ/RimL family protein N-acetyltransferase
LIEPENFASQHVAEKIGMTHEKDVIRPGGVVRRLYVLHADRTDE